MNGIDTTTATYMARSDAWLNDRPARICGHTMATYTNATAARHIAIAANCRQLRPNIGFDS